MNGALAVGQRPGRCILPVPAVGVERESTLPYWFWAPLPGAGVTLKNLAEEGELHCEERPGGDWETHLTRPSEVKMSLVISSAVLTQPTEESGVTPRRSSRRR